MMFDARSSGANFCWVRVNAPWLAACFSVALAMGADACPVCDSPTGLQVREAIFNGDLLRNLVLTVAPFPILGAIAAWIHFGGRKPADAVSGGK